MRLRPIPIKLIKKLSCHYRKVALIRHKQSTFTPPYEEYVNRRTSLNTELIYAFHWKLTPEGYSYWAKVAEITRVRKVPRFIKRRI